MNYRYHCVAKTTQYTLDLDCIKNFIITNDDHIQPELPENIEIIRRFY